MLIELSNECYVAADQITEVRIKQHARSITVKTKDGMEHGHLAPYGISLYAELDRLVVEVNKAQGERNE